ncbi:G5 domain-containing protein [Actinoplanes sp. GCM10030250]|uniref:G5 domain-containing protein n=1 Tax=Actinoplanes sp. GCM10030250 TaxID=3273376 RepID=UPI0036086EB6
MPRKSWWARLPFGLRMAAGTGALLVLIGGGAVGVAALTGDDPSTTAAAGGAVAEVDLGAPMLDEDPEVVSRAAAAAEPLPQRHTAAPTHVTTAAPATDQLSRARAVDDPADRTGPRAVRTAAGEKSAERDAPVPALPPAPPAPPAQPVVTTRTDVETRPIPFQTQLIRDPSLPRGARRVDAPGAPGAETLRYLVTVIDGKPANRRLVDTTVTRQPEPRVVAFGARRKFDRYRDRGCERVPVCVPLGRSAVCPEDAGGKAATGHAKNKPRNKPQAREENTAVQLGGSVLVEEQDLELVTPETLDDVRLEPATLC